MSQSLPSVKIAVTCWLLWICFNHGETALARHAIRQHGSMRPRTGIDLHRQLLARVDLTWSQVPLRGAVESLAQGQRIAIFLDRRIDPDRKIDFSAANVSLRQGVEKLAGSQGMGVSYVGAVIYLGPRETTAKLPAVIRIQKDRVARFPRDVRGRLQQPRPWQWRALAQPRELMRELADEIGIEIHGIDQVPHDLWPAMSLPPLGFTERIALVAAGFDLAIEYAMDGTSARLVPMPRNVSLGQEPHRAARSLASPTPSRRPAKNQPQQRHTLRVINEPAESVLRAVAARRSLALQPDANAGPRLSERITLLISDATFEQLLDAVLEPLRLDYEIRGDTLHVRSRPPAPRP